MPNKKIVYQKDVGKSVVFSHEEKSSSRADQNRITDLHRAINQQNKYMVKFLVETIENINLRNENGDHSLHVAAKVGNIGITRLLLSKKMWLNVRNSKKQTPLHIAVQSDAIDIVKLLIRKKCRINTQDYVGNSPLHDAVNNNNFPIVELLLKNRANPNCLNNERCSPFYKSLTKYDDQMVKLFLQYDVNPHIKNYCGENALHLASQYCTKEMMQWILDMNVSSNEPTHNIGHMYYTNLPIHYVLKSSWNEDVTLEKIRLLVRYGANIDKKDGNGKTALFFAIRKRYCKLIKYLLRQRANVNSCGTTSRWNSPLVEALLVGDAEIVDVLLKHGANIRIRNKSGDGPLHIAASIFRGESGCRVLGSLLNRGARVNSRGNNQSTPLHEVLNNRDSKMFQMLIYHGADINLKDSRGLAPLHIAIRKNLYPEAKRLLKLGASVGDKDASKISVLKLAIIHSTANMVRLLLRYGVEIKEKTLMTTAAKMGDLEVMRLLVSKGVDVNEVESEMSVLGNGITSIKAENRMAVVQYLLSIGADVNFEFKGTSPLSVALCAFQGASESPTSASVVNVLLKHIALLSSKNSYVSEHNLQLIESKPVIGRKYRVYCQELARMKSTRIRESSSVTYYDLLVMKNVDLYRHLRSSKIRNAVESANCRIKFENYFAQLAENCRDGWYRLQVIERVEEVLDDIFKRVLPREITSKILEYLNRDDFKYLLVL